MNPTTYLTPADEVKEMLKSIEIPFTILEDKNLSPHQKIIYGALWTLNEVELLHLVSNKMLSELLCLTYSSISCALNRLCEKGYIYTETYRRNIRKIVLIK